MLMSNYLSEAFQKLNVLDEDTFSVTEKDMEELQDVIDAKDDEVIDIIDPDATTEDELKDDYIGKVILDCNVCHSKIYKDEEDVVVNETEESVNVNEECPFCYSSEGYKVIGKIDPFVSDEHSEDKDSEEVEIEEEKPETISEGCKGTKRKTFKEWKKLKEDTEETHSGKWVNRGDTGETHGTFKTKKEADAQRKAMFARGYKTEAKDLTTIKGTLGAALQNHKDELAQVTDRKSALEFIDKIADEVKSKAYLDKVKLIISKKPDSKVLQYLYDTLLSSAGEKVISDSLSKEKPLKENDQAADVLAKYQKWVDYDMKRYGKVSDKTNKELKDAGFELVKDDHGDYEVTSKMDEDFNHVSVTTDDSTLEMDAEEDGEIVISSKPTEEEVEVEETEEVIKPLDIEDKEKIEANTDEDEIDVDIDEFSEEEFDEMGESYLKEVYENVSSYKTTSVASSKNKLFVEGLITFNSGKSKKTSFVFEAKDVTKKGKVRFIGENKQITRGSKAFILTGTVNNKNFLTESFRYNYKAKDNQGNSRRIYGTIKK
jgi:hypothetical protein